MPYLGVGLHLLIVIYFAVHVIRSGRELYWLVIMFMFPLLGCAVYFFAVYLPESRIQHHVHKTVKAVARSLDPERELREARSAFELTPTAQNQMRLANALLDSGAVADAAVQFDACLQGPFARDPEIRLAAAQAHLLSRHAERALELASAVRADNPSYSAERQAILLAQIYDALDRQADAEREFQLAAQQFGSLDAKVELAEWALRQSRPDQARQICADIDLSARHMPAHARQMNRDLLSRVERVKQAVS